MSTSTSFILFHYTPSLPAAIIFTILFSLVTFVHVVQLARYRAWFMTPVVVGGFFEIISYISRCVSHSSPESLMPYIIGSVLALVAPALFAATIYMTLGRLIRVLRADRYSLIKVTWLTKIFVAFDILSFLVQSSGAGMQAKGTSSSRLGQNLVLVGLFLQIAIFAFFVVIAAVFHRRILRQPTQASQGVLSWKPHMNGLYASSALVLLRNLIRVVEYVQGHNGYIRRHQWVLYIFDALLMFAVMVVLAVVYAPSLLKQGKMEGLGETTVELKGKNSKQTRAAEV